MALETLGFRREGLSPSFVLLVPAFSLPNAPHHLAVYASLQFGMLLYHMAEITSQPTSRHITYLFCIWLVPLGGTRIYVDNSLHCDFRQIRSFGVSLSPGTFSALKLLTSELLRYL